MPFITFIAEGIGENEFSGRRLIISNLKISSWIVLNVITSNFTNGG